VLSLFQITVVDNWDDFIWSALESQSLAYGGIYSLYFLAFFVILVLVITNVLTSSIIEAYDEQVQGTPYFASFGLSSLIDGFCRLSSKKRS
jgi:hypothetical protein